MFEWYSPGYKLPELSFSKKEIVPYIDSSTGRHYEESYMYYYSRPVVIYISEETKNNNRKYFYNDLDDSILYWTAILQYMPDDDGVYQYSFVTYDPLIFSPDEVIAWSYIPDLDSGVWNNISDKVPDVHLCGTSTDPWGDEDKTYSSGPVIVFNESLINENTNPFGLSVDEYCVDETKGEVTYHNFYTDNYACYKPSLCWIKLPEVVRDEEIICSPQMGEEQ